VPWSGSCSLKSFSVKTVETHCGAVTQRLGIRNVASQVRYAVRVGLVPQNGSQNEAA
jgi:hypothetical protein